MRQARLFRLSGVVALMLGMMVVVGGASSHRESPLLAHDPQADNTDLWAFVDPASPGKLNIIAAYYPFEMPAGFPNGYTFGEELLYTIRIDNTGDGIADKSYGFDFETIVNFPLTFYSNVTLKGDLAITAPNDPDLNIAQTYDVVMADNSSLPAAYAGSPKIMAQDLYTSPNNIGPKSTPEFENTMMQAIHELPDGSRVWAGQADDPFFADLGALWDLGQLRTITGDNNGEGIDALKDFNVQVIALEIPIEEVTADGMMPTDPAAANAAIGIWAANFRQSTEVLKPTIRTTDFPNEETVESNRPDYSGAYTQVSRLGMPLTNEVIILLQDKDRWNRTEPVADAQYEEYYLNSHLAVLLNALFETPGATENRQDLRAIFLTGLPGLTQVGESPALADMLRINLAAADSDFPNGRDLDDDVIDIGLSVVGLSDGTFEGLVTEGISDGVDANDVPFMSEFPYVGVPHAGYYFDADAEEDGNGED